MKKPFVPTPIGSLEEDLIEAKILLRSGLDVSLSQLSSAAKHAGDLMKDQVKTKLKKLELLGEEAIDQIELRAGELNYLAGEGDIRDIETFDRLAAPLSKSIHDARQSLKRLDEKGHQELGDLSGQLGAAWRSLHLHIEIVRLNLALAESGTAEACKELREALVKKFEAAAAEAKQAKKEHDAHSLVARLFDGIKTQVKGVSNTFRTLFTGEDSS